MLLVGRQKGIRAVKNIRGDGGGRYWLVPKEWRPVGWSVCLPLLIFPCIIKSRNSLLAPTYPGGTGKTAVKRLWWCCIARGKSQLTSGQKKVWTVDSRVHVVGSRPSDHYFRSVCWFVCLCKVFLSRLWSDFDQTWTYVIYLGLVVSPRI